MKKINISIIIPVYDDSQGLITSLESINFHLGNRKDTEVIVCNDGGGDSISKIAELYNVKEVRLNKNRGSYAARNKGIEASKGDILVFLDADQKITENWLNAGVAALSISDYAGGLIKIEEVENPTDWELLNILTAFPVKNYLENSHFAPTANLFINKKILTKVGQFNEILYSGGDYDFGLRVFNNGFKQVFAPDAITFHPVRNKSEQLRKLKRTAYGYVDLLFLVQNSNKLLFIIDSFKRLILVPFEMIWRIFRFPFFDYWKNDKINFKFIYIKKLKKFIYTWFLLKHAFGIIFNKFHKILFKQNT